MSGSMQAAVTGLELRGGSLIQRAVQILRARPLPTALVAEMVLGLRGNPPAAAAAVFTLLGSDSRFAVDSRGVWSLLDAPRVVSAGTLLDEDWVVVDVETTGGSPAHGHRITEVAAVWISGGRITDSYSTLVNPDRRIPSMITALTGINDEMVRDAPRFYEIAPRLVDALQGRVFVAHNAAFDWRFVGSELQRCMGRELAGRQLCTVRLARKLLPQLPSRSLDALAHFFGLEIESRHRALDDAVATAQLLTRLMSMLQDRGVADWAGVEEFLAKRARKQKRTRLPRSMDQA